MGYDLVHILRRNSFYTTPRHFTDLYLFTLNSITPSAQQMVKEVKNFAAFAARQIKACLIVTKNFIHTWYITVLEINRTDAGNLLLKDSKTVSLLKQCSNEDSARIKWIKLFHSKFLHSFLQEITIYKRLLGLYQGEFDTWNQCLSVLHESSEAATGGVL